GRAKEEDRRSDHGHRPRLRRFGGRIYFATLATGPAAHIRQWTLVQWRLSGSGGRSERGAGILAGNPASQTGAKPRPRVMPSIYEDRLGTKQIDKNHRSAAAAHESNSIRNRCRNWRGYRQSVGTMAAENRSGQCSAVSS